MTGFLEDASFNQSPAFGDIDIFSADKPLAEAAARCGLDTKSLAACGKDDKGPPPPPEVSIVTLKPRTVAITDQLPGRTTAFKVAEVRPQVTGIVQNVDSLTRQISAGKGTMGKLVTQDQMYDAMLKLINDFSAMLADIRKDPSRYTRGLVNLKVF